MINISECVEYYGLDIKKREYIDDYIILYCADDKKYLLKNKDSNKEELFNYLKSINYRYYLDIINSYNDSYELYPYYEDKINDNYNKCKEIINALISLHLNSFSYINLNNNGDFIRQIYEEYNSKIDITMKYYLDLQDYIDEMDFLLPQYYLLIINISKIYNLLKFSKSKLDDWYQSKIERYREVVCVGDVSCDNFRFGEKSYFIDWKNSNNNLIVYDFVEFYKSEYNDVDMISLFNMYNSKINFTSDEFSLFLSIISIPDIIKFGKDNYNDTIRVRKLIDYVDKTNHFVLEEDEKNQKANEQEFKE